MDKLLAFLVFLFFISICSAAQRNFRVKFQIVEYEDLDGRLPKENGEFRSCFTKGEGPPVPSKAEFCNIFFRTSFLYPNKTIQSWISNEHIHSTSSVKINASSDTGDQHQLMDFWRKPFIFDELEKPEKLLITVMHYGGIYQGKTSLVSGHTYVIVDEFLLNIAEKIPFLFDSPVELDLQAFSLRGQLVDSLLEIKFGLRCLVEGRTGQYCELQKDKCKEVNEKKKLCPAAESANEEKWFLCDVDALIGSQVTNCSLCPSGEADADGGCTSPTDSCLQFQEMVSASYKGATIALAVICAILAICLLVVLLHILFQRRHEKKVEEAKKRRNEWETTRVAALSRPAEKAYSNQAYSSVPDPEPRSRDAPDREETVASETSSYEGGRRTPRVEVQV